MTLKFSECIKVRLHIRHVRFKKAKTTYLFRIVHLELLCFINNNKIYYCRTSTDRCTVPMCSNTPAPWSFLIVPINYILLFSTATSTQYYNS